jgi:hypothetical protein
MKDILRDYKLKKHNNLNDLFEGNFDVTWQKHLEQLPTNKKLVFTITPTEVRRGVIDDKTVTYRYNNDFFRCDNFIEKHDGKHILFGGCSETEGVGGNIEDAWSHMLYNKISKEEKVSGFFNLSKSGWGWNRIIVNSLIYFKKYGYPDVYFILLPNHERNFSYKNESSTLENLFTYDQKYPEPYFDYVDATQDNNRSSPKEYFENFIHFLINWKTFYELCEAKNIKLIFSTWDELDGLNLQNIFFNNFFLLTRENERKFINGYAKNNKIKPEDLKKRDGHNGKIGHIFWAQEFYKKYKEVLK